MNDAYSPARLADRAEITDILYRWCRAADRRDWNAVRKVFHPDAIDNHGPFVGGVEELIAWMAERHRTIPFSMHLVSNILIEFATADSALAETYIFAKLRYSAEGKAALAVFTGSAEGGSATATDSFSWARYIDRFERRKGEWRIARRTVAFDSSLTADVPADAPAFDPSWAVGRRDKVDPLYKERAAMGLID
ncbi:MAG TPA: nuclear transport factor 2 family protein [Alphaproteobacteria bacterium]|nr:nuclear transport factor 2 family protein [Alphaproteobacteria bacterium]